MLAATLAMLMGIALFGCAFVMFVLTMEDLKYKRFPHRTYSVQYMVAVSWFILALLGIFTIVNGVLLIIAHVV